MRAEPKVAAEIECFGRVQGVFYRVSTKERAVELGIAGWVKNLDTGAVLIHAEGSKEAVDQLINWCRKGPVLAKVSKVVINKTAIEEFDEFEITY